MYHKGMDSPPSLPLPAEQTLFIHSTGRSVEACGFHLPKHTTSRSHRIVQLNSHLVLYSAQRKSCLLTMNISLFQWCRETITISLFFPFPEGETSKTVSISSQTLCPVQKDPFCQGLASQLPWKELQQAKGIIRF